MPALLTKLAFDPKLVADQLGHGLEVNLEVYTKSDLSRDQLSEAVKIMAA